MAAILRGRLSRPQQEFVVGHLLKVAAVEGSILERRCLERIATGSFAILDTLGADLARKD